MVIVDRFSKAARFIPLPKLPTAKETAELVINHVFRVFGIPQDIASDRGPQFASQFWQVFCQSLGATVSLSSGFHPESNGQGLNKVLRLHWGVWQLTTHPLGLSSSCGLNTRTIPFAPLLQACPLLSASSGATLHYSLSNKWRLQFPLLNSLLNAATRHGKRPDSSSLRSLSSTSTRLIADADLPPLCPPAKEFGSPLRTFPCGWSPLNFFFRGSSAPSGLPGKLTQLLIVYTCLSLWR